MLVDRARPERLGDLVRSLSRDHPDVEVYTNAVELTQVSEGALAVLVPDPKQASWLNLERPIFANRALRVILFSDADTSGVLARRAPDFFNWISHRIECPEGAPLPAVRGTGAVGREPQPRYRSAFVVRKGVSMRCPSCWASPARVLPIVSTEPAIIATQDWRIRSSRG